MWGIVLAIILVIVVLYFGRKILDLGFKGVVELFKLIFKWLGIGIKKIFSLIAGIFKSKK